MKRLLTGLALGIFLACGSPEPPVARVSLDRDFLPLFYPGYTSLLLNWQLEPEAGQSSEGTGVFVHLLDEEGNLVRTFDHPFPGPWRAGVEVEDRVVLYQSALGPALPEGRYSLTLGLTNAQGERLPLDAPGPDRGSHEYEVALVRVGSAPRKVSLAFEGGWGGVEAGDDRQVLARRWLSNEGTLRVAGARPGDRVLLQIRIPDPSRYGSSFEMMGEGTVPEVEVATPCGEETVVVSGQGLHRMEPRLGESEAQECSLDLRANFNFQDPGRGGEKLSAVLEVISYRPE